MAKMRLLVGAGVALAAGAALSEVPAGAVPAGCDPSVMGEKYWDVWNADVQAKIDADIAANRMADAVVTLDGVPAGTEVTVEQTTSDFRFGAHIFNFNQLGKTEWNDAYKASYGAGGLFNQATVAFYWNAYEPTSGHLRAHGMYEDSEQYWNALTVEAAQKDPYWRRPAPGPVVDYLKARDVAIHGHILIWGLAKPYWIYDRYCPENEKRAFDKLGVPRHAGYMKRAPAGAEQRFGYLGTWRAAWKEIFAAHSEEEIEAMAPVFCANMRRIFRKRVTDVARDFGDAADSWDVVNESSEDWAVYHASRTGRKIWKSGYGLMPGDYPLDALLDAKEAMAPTAKLAINDWNVCQDFLDQVQDLEKEGAKIDLVGCQMHIFDTNECMKLANGQVKGNWKGMWVGSRDTINDRLDMMAKTGRKIHVSEVTISATGTSERDRQIQAILAHNIYRAWFAHRATMGITWWNTVDGGGVAGEPLVSGLFTRDMQKKPVYKALDALINGAWRTREKVRSKGEEGRSKESKIAFRGFCGRYRLSWKCPECGETHFKTIHLGKGGADADGPDIPEYVCRQFVRSYAVDGKKVEIPAGERDLDLAKIYPDQAVKGRDGNRTATLVFTLDAPEDGQYALYFRNDWWGHLYVNGRDLGAKTGPWPEFAKVEVALKAGANEARFETRAGSAGKWKTAFALEKK